MIKPEQINQERMSTVETVASVAVFLGGIVLDNLVPGAIFVGLAGSTVLFIDGMRRS